MMKAARPSAGGLRAADVAAAAQLACLLEVSAPKPGNVSPGRHFADARYEDFLASAVAIGEPLAGAGTRSVGATVRLAVEATARWTRSNTNVGLVLLLAPLARAALLEKGVGRLFPGAEKRPRDPLFSGGGEEKKTPDPFFPNAGGAKKAPNPFIHNDQAKMAPDAFSPGVGEGTMTPDPFSGSLRDAVRRVLEATTIDDARDLYAAIRCASPGGLGRVEAQDVADEPTMPLLDVMRLAAGRDGIAREYATAFEVTFERAAPALEQARRDGLSWDDAIVETFLTLLAASPDTHVSRRGGADLAVDVSRRARAVVEKGGVRSEAGRRAIGELDLALRDERNVGNPGTTADLTAAAIFVVLLGGGWSPSV
jgi:triphosphoribosyl-dephospho-CoA synthetase